MRIDGDNTSFGPSLRETSGGTARGPFVVSRDEYWSDILSSDEGGPRVDVLADVLELPCNQVKCKIGKPITVRGIVTLRFLGYCYTVYWLSEIEKKNLLVNKFLRFFLLNIKTFKLLIFFFSCVNVRLVHHLTFYVRKNPSICFGVILTCTSINVINKVNLRKDYVLNSVHVFIYLLLFCNHS